MNTVIKDSFGEGDDVAYEIDNYLMDKVLKSLARNNTFCPNITRCYLQKGIDCKVFNRKHNKNTTAKRDVLRVSFADDTWVEVVRNPNDSNDLNTAILYAIVKRMFGAPNESGYVSGNGFMGKIKTIVSNINTPEKEAEEKANRIKAKLEKDKAEHEAAMLRKAKNPSLGLRMKNLEDKFEKLIDTLGK